MGKRTETTKGFLGRDLIGEKSEGLSKKKKKKMSLKKKSETAPSGGARIVENLAQ